MANYLMEDGTIVNTKLSKEYWTEGSRWNGHNYISLATGSQWEHQRLYKSNKGRYYIEYTSDFSNMASRAEWIDPTRACAWLLANDHDPTSDEFPADLKILIETISE